MERSKSVIPHQQEYTTNSIDNQEDDEKLLVINSLSNINVPSTIVSSVNDKIHNELPQVTNSVNKQNATSNSTNPGQRNYKCNKCGKLLSSQHALNEHNNIHTNHKPHKCSTCGFESHHLSVYLRHTMIHEKTRGFVCYVCGKSFKMSHYLQKHLRKHSGDKCCSCNICGKGFTCKSELNMHSKRHSSERPHKCEHCGKLFKMLHNLKSHIKKCIGDNKWKCTICTAVFPKHNLLEAHKKVHKEGIQQLQVTRPKEDLLVVSVGASDRRKLPTFHSVNIPQDSVFPSKDSEQCKKLFRIQDSYIPLNMLLQFCNKGNSLQIKIIDETKPSKSEMIDTSQPIIEIVDNDATDADAKIEQVKLNASSINKNEYLSCEIEEVEEPLQISHVLSATESIINHCSNGLVHQVFDHNYLSWINTLVCLCKELAPPFEHKVCAEISSITSVLQATFLKYSSTVEANENHDKSTLSEENTTVVQPIDKELENGIKIKTDLSKCITVSTKDLKHDSSYMSSLYRCYVDLNKILFTHWDYLFSLKCNPKLLDDK